MHCSCSIVLLQCMFVGVTGAGRLLLQLPIVLRERGIVPSRDGVLPCSELTGPRSIHREQMHCMKTNRI